MASVSSLAPPPVELARPHSPLPGQVAGHQNVMSDESGSLVIKPALPREIAFYQLLAESPRSAPWTRLRPFVPQFYGTLKLEGRLDGAGGLQSDIPEKGEVPESVVLENLAHAFTHPNILDAKLGTVLYSPEATDEKKARMEKQAKESTTFETGLRLTGCQAWHAPSSSYILTPKSFGKTITVDQLPSGMIRFFPSPTDTVSSLIPAQASSPTTSTSSSLPAPAHIPLTNEEPSASTEPPVKDEGAAEPAAPPEVPPTPVAAAPTSPTTYANHAIPATTLVQVLELIDAQLEALETVLSTLEMRFVGASVLIVYEGDPERLEQALMRYQAMPVKPLVHFSSPGGASDATEVDDDEDEEEYDEDEEDASSSSDDDSLDGARADARVKRRCPPFTVKMIDFAHTWLAEGEGPDEGVLKGLKTLRGLVRDRAVEMRRSETLE